MNLNLGKPKVQMRILVTSRKETYISKYFETILQGLYRSAHLERISSQNHVRDSHSLHATEEVEEIGINNISKFLKHILSGITDTQQWPKD